MNDQEQQGMSPEMQPASELPATPPGVEEAGHVAVPEPVAAPAPVPETPAAPEAPVAPEQPPAMPPQPPAAPEAPAAPETEPVAEPEPAPEAPVAPEQPAAQVPPAQPPTPDQNPWNAQPSIGHTAPASWQVPQQSTQAAPSAGYTAPTQPAPQPPVQPQKKSNTGLIVGGIVGVLLAAVAIVLVAFVIPNLNKPTASTGDVTIDEPYTDAPSVDDPSGGQDVPLEGDQEAAVTAAAEAKLDGLANAEPDALVLIGDIANEGFENQTDESFQDCGVDPQEYAQIMLEGFTYTIDDVYVYESIGEATVYATVTCRDVFDLIDNYNYMLDAYTNSDEFDKTTYEEDRQRMGMIFIEAAESAKMNDGYQMLIDLEYENGAWVVDDDQWESELDWLFDVE